ncbi:nucleotidyl transferase AbiEii/AbiGii toxin family protein [Treponema brennaborense]|uniref:Nucleotidyl transferase AbiEii/AbiGii toxin family protein n=1 Tax=Treponema brennaborense (strain DSM 12168 / CIP 105900 / DD5/3) TaxID=906968 RepID=F4LIK0_TREBD|nr:nucleotidyl transferase AbiEii/AbiGii toxin family protein [Treponema brennaborense]AEE17225.1 Domain of unknown function DUF1814 [Treponema brennaborense DSM 12168]
MTAFDTLVENVVSEKAEYPALRNVIEKELLHQDILRTMSATGILKNLTFMGGTCLRDCYGSPRLSEDLDFTGGFDFSKDDMQSLGDSICRAIQRKYSLSVTVTEPVKDFGNTDTWKIKVITRPEKPDFPAQKINIDICRLPSHDRKPSMLKNMYGVDMGTDGILLYAESLQEILCDKLIAFARRPNRVKNRDLWDIHWITQKNIDVKNELLLEKLSDRQIPEAEFKNQYKERIASIQQGQKDFLFEMRRFLLPSAFSTQFTSEIWWQYLLGLLEELAIR